MKKYTEGFVLTAAMLVILAAMSPTLALAHEHDVFKIGGKTYQFTIGSLGEPLIVDEKSGLDLNVSESGRAVTGLEKTLKVEMIAGSEKKTMDLEPAWNSPGAYETVFYPTVQTTFSYRLFGTINNVPVDLSFSCSSGEIDEDAEDDSIVTMGEATRTHRSGAFGCAEAKADYGFPEQAATSADIRDLQKSVAANKGARTLAIIAIAIGAAGFVSGSMAMRKKK